MNEMMESYAEKLLAALESGANWLEGEIPLLAQEVLTYYTWESIALIAAGLALAVACFWLARRAVNYEAKDRWDDWVLAWGGGSAIAGIMSLVFLLVGVPQFLKVTVAPRLFLIEWLRGFV